MNETETTTTPSVWNKTADELTIADNLKVQGTIIAVMVMIPVVLLGSVVAYENIKARRQARKAAKVIKIVKDENEK